MPRVTNNVPRIVNDAARLADAPGCLDMRRHEGRGARSRTIKSATVPQIKHGMVGMVNSPTFCCTAAHVPSNGLIVAENNFQKLKLHANPTAVAAIKIIASAIVNGLHPCFVSAIDAVPRKISDFMPGIVTRRLMQRKIAIDASRAQTALPIAWAAFCVRDRDDLDRVFGFSLNHEERKPPDATESRAVEIRSCQAWPRPDLSDHTIELGDKSKSCRLASRGVPSSCGASFRDRGWVEFKLS